MRIDLHAQAIEMSTKQAGVISRQQLLAIGFSDERIRSYLRSRKFSRIARGVFNTVTGPPTQNAQLWAAVLRGGDGAFIYGRSALKLWGFETQHKSNRFRDQATDAQNGENLTWIGVPHGARRPIEPQIQVVHVRTPREVMRLGDLPVEVPAWALIDSVRDMTSEEEVQDLILNATQSRVVRLQDLKTALVGRRVPHGHVIRQTILLTEEGVTTPLERKGRRNVIDQHGLPRGEWQQEITLEGIRMVVDVFYRDQGVIVEFDGQMYHDSSQARARDRDRDNRSLSEGLVTLRIGTREATRSPCVPAGRLAGLLIQRGWSGLPTKCHRKGCVVV